MKNINVLAHAKIPFKQALERLIGLLSRPVSKDVLGSFAIRLIFAGLTFAGSMLAARLLGPAEFGVYAYADAALTLLAVLSKFGLHILIVRETARGIARGEYGLVKGFWRWAESFAGLVSFVLALGVVAALIAGGSASRRVETMLWGVALLPLIALGDLRSAALRGLQRVLEGQLAEFLARPGLFVVLLLGLWFAAEKIAPSAPITMGLYTFAAAAAFLIGWYLLRRATPPAVKQSDPHFYAREWFKSALPLAFLSSMVIINQQIAVIIQGFFMPDASIGIFRVAVQIAQMASFAVIAVSMVIMPRFSTFYALGDTAKLQRLAKRSSQITLLFNWLIVMGFLLAGKAFLRYFFGTSYLDAYPVTLVLFVGELINSATGSVASLLVMTPHEKATARIRLYALAANAALNFLLTPFLGIWGAAIAVSFSTTLWNVALWQIAKKNLGIDTLAFSPSKRN